MDMNIAHSFAAWSMGSGARPQRPPPQPAQRTFGTPRADAGGSVGSATLPQVPLVVATGADAAGAIQTALEGTSPWPLPGAEPIAVLILGGQQRRDDPLEVAADRLTRFLHESAPNAEVNIHRKPSWRSGTVRPRSGVAWKELASSNLAARLVPVRVLRRLAEAEARCLVAPLPSPRADRRRSPIIALAAYAHPRQRLAIRLTPVETGLAAEFALALRPLLTVLVGALGPRSLVVATTDVVAAELAWLALRDDDAEPERPAPGPWEDPVVQRATELDLGVRLPAQLEVALRSADAGPDPLLSAVGERLRLRLGIVRRDWHRSSVVPAP